MSDLLRPYYDRELDALRRLSGEFAEAHPKIAERLRIKRDVVDDPHVERLLEGVAFLAARVQHRLDDEFPELTDALLGILYPHYLAPVPSTAIAYFDVDPAAPGATTLPARAEIETEPVRGEPCRYRTASEATLWPIEVESVRLSGLPLAAPANPTATQAVACLRIGLRCTAPDGSFGKLGLNRVRLFLRGSTAPALLELLLAHAISVAVATEASDPTPVILGKDVITHAGFAPEEALFPFPARSFTGFRLLTEYFAAPDKFHFVDISGLQARTLLGVGGRLEIFVYLSRPVADLDRLVDASAMATNCVPIVNLFEQRCAPIQLDHTVSEYRVVPDVYRPRGTEIWSIEQVRETFPDGSVKAWHPFYRLAQSSAGAAEELETGGHYTVTRKRAERGGTDVFLGLHMPEFEPTKRADSDLSVEALCFNRDLPSDLPFGGGRPTMEFAGGPASIKGVSCLTAPTPTLRRPLREHGAWRLLSHLSLGHLSVVGGEDAARALQEVLRLYDVRDTADTGAAIRALVAVSSHPGTARVEGARPGAFCRGLDVQLTFDPAAWSAVGLYVLAAVLERFLALHATVNSFVRTSVKLRGRAEVVASWPPRAGAHVLL